ncbi:hypothetical protein [Providencia rettgeri]|uniref:hypothetical protein n=1 Tax=Providencia rettgeri TaxID=587 RepID=UPI001E47B8BB|nr:hypothetical protein LMY39_14390 [Providencia rettgeri]
MDKSRQQFEEFIKFHMNEPEPNNNLDTSNNGLNYADVGIDLMWISWQASRDSLLLSLPEREKSNNRLDRFSIAYNEGIAACEQHLLDMGVKIKNE